jgi:hypothetical protein
LKRHKKSKNAKFFPLNFDHAVFFPDCQFKQDFEHLQYSFTRIFDESNLETHKIWNASKEKEKGDSPLEQFLITLLNQHSHFRVYKPKVGEFFVRLLGANITRVISLKKYYAIREQELEEVNMVQDFLLASLIKKNRCIFEGSAGSGKTFVAMKKTIELYNQRKKTLVLCFNSELRDFMKEYISSKLGRTYKRIQGRVDIYSVHSFLNHILSIAFNSLMENLLKDSLSDFQYEPIAEKLREVKDQIPLSILYDAILIDEAQDIDPSLWEVFEYFLKNPKKALLYVFYDAQQALFVRKFSPLCFGMDESEDVIVLHRNLRNTIQIANWLQNQTHFGNYKDLSGIHGFKITTHTFDNASQAIIRALNIIAGKFYGQGIAPEKIALLGYHKLRTMIPTVQSIENCDYLELSEKQSQKKLYLIEPKSITEMERIKSCQEISSNRCTLFKTISSFKGLESDILFLIVPEIQEFKQHHPDLFENFMMQLYVGASRAKFKLYFFQFKMNSNKSG